MAEEINLLEAEIVKTRQVLACYLPQPWADGLRQDIFSGLAARFAGCKEYDRFVAYCNNGDDTNVSILRP